MATISVQCLGKGKDDAHTLYTEKEIHSFTTLTKEGVKQLIVKLTFLKTAVQTPFIQEF